jgi:hypothetical protein
MNFRYSAINTAYQCYKRYEIEYIEGRRSPPSSEMEFGTALHLALSSYLESKDAEFALMNFNNYWNTCQGMQFRRDTWEQLKDKAEVLFTRWVRLHSKKYEPVYIEQQIDFTVGKHKFSGTPDYVGSYDGVPSVVDFKTASTIYDAKKIIINEQMPLYAHAVAQKYDYKAQQLVYVVFVKNPEPRIQVLTRQITPEQIEKALDNVILMCDDLSTRERFPMNRNSCMYCSHYKSCYKES